MTQEIYTIMCHFSPRQGGFLHLIESIDVYSAVIIIIRKASIDGHFDFNPSQKLFEKLGQDLIHHRSDRS